MYDFHTHTFLSDGVLTPIELIHRAQVIGYRVIAVTDHVGPGNMEFVLNTLIKECAVATRNWDILALPGVEITHCPKDEIDLLAKEAKALGAKVVNVHGETVSEPVEPGTNLAAVNSAYVDILAHPGLIRAEEAAIAARNGVFLEVSGRKSHAFANGHVVKTARQVGAGIVLDSDAHEPQDLMTREFALKVARGAGLGLEDATELLDEAPRDLMARLAVSEAALEA